MADNQEHLLTGGPLKSFSPLTERFVTTFGLRSPLANVGGRLLMREALRFGRERGAGLVLHLGDATDISCESELESVFEALNQEAPDEMWFMTPGNHDGILAGNFAKYQDPPCLVRERPTFYDTPPLDGYGVEQNIWYYACQSPASPGADMPRGRAIELYVEMLKKRPHVKPPKSEPDREILTFVVEGERDPVHVLCHIEEVEIEPPPPSVVKSYKAVARVCEPRQVPGRTTFVGQYASFIVQRIDVGDTRIVLLDTSDYESPTKKRWRLLPALPVVMFDGEVTDCQRRRAESLFQDGGGPFNRRNVIVAGHHPFADLPEVTQKWIAEKSGRYMSAHVHTSTSIIEHNKASDRELWELNIGSTLDYPPQAVFAEMTSESTSVRVAGAKTDWPDDFLAKCRAPENVRGWKLPDKFYRGYRKGLYVGHLLTALREAADKYDDVPGRAPLQLDIPTGREKGDWERLHRALEAINKAEGDARTFWACQAYYASAATRKERGFLADRLAPRLGFGFESGRLIPGGWATFSTP